jgi:hypothetical protein
MVGFLCDNFSDHYGQLVRYMEEQSIKAFEDVPASGRAHELLSRPKFPAVIEYYQKG